MPVRDVARYMYSNGYDLRHFVTMAISPAIAEVILCAYHGVRACAAGPEPREGGIPDRLKREQMLALTHGLLGSANILKTALYGWNPMEINLAQFQTLAVRMPVTGEARLRKRPAPFGRGCTTDGKLSSPTTYATSSLQGYHNRRGQCTPATIVSMGEMMNGPVWSIDDTQRRPSGWALTHGH